jgi:hypothetical protein
VFSISRANFEWWKPNIPPLLFSLHELLRKIFAFYKPFQTLASHGNFSKSCSGFWWTADKWLVITWLLSAQKNADILWLTWTAC